MNLLHGYFLKLRRAKDHLDSITCEIGAFIEGDFHLPVPALHEVEEDWLTLRWTGLSPLPEMWGVMVGDFVHNVRSALDHLMWNLVLANGSVPGKHTMFPIMQSERDWIELIEHRDDALGPAPTAGASADVLRIIKAAQPYHLRNQAKHAPLMLLLRLSNVDKHRTVHVGIAYTTQRQKFLSFDPAGYIKIRKVKFPPVGTIISNGAIVARVQCAFVAEPPAEMAVQFKAPVTVAFGEIGKQALCTVATLKRILDEAVSIVGSFAGVFAAVESAAATAQDEHRAP